MICKEIPKTMYCHIGGSGTWGCEFPEDLNMEGITLLKRDMEFETPSLHYSIQRRRCCRRKDGEQS